MIKQTQPSNIIYFIGGGADKTREKFGPMFWGPTYLMRDAMMAFNFQQGPYSLTEYYSYLEKKQLVKDITTLKKRFPNLAINLVGHSRGAAVAKEIATKNLRKRDIPVNILVALDPVKTRLDKQYKLPKKKAIKNVNRFINIFAKPRFKSFADIVAMVGGQYGHRLQGASHDFTQVNLGHGKPIALLNAAVEQNGISSFDMLLAESFRPSKKLPEQAPYEALN